ncbi:valine--tRNA ligase [Ehrlichia japonica]|uniref:Valine--tRNA ligase n=2 Tax=Ehrlichia japonica TaxID=391036 RepID=X5GBC2_9RICK|nr:valine--tRNA ligase [Ehrlichia japonica]
MGHIFSYCHTDFIARYQRMLGKDVFYPIGFDDNGLPTERLVEKTKKIRATDISRKEFNTICRQVSHEFRIQFKQLFQSIGISYDWDLEYHTISENIQKISQASFINLYNKGKLYRKLQPIFWDCIDKTAIARAEVEENEISSFMNTITFSTETGIPINIATTRPELMPACVAVFFHPSDARYKHLLGQNVIVPIFGNKVKILPDDQVKIDKGTGLVMCCTFGDEMDVYWWNKHNLDTKIIISKSGTIYNLTSNTPQGQSVCNQLHGLSIIKARALILEILDQNNLLRHKQEIIHNVKCAERSGAPIEILLSHQWFIKVVEIKQELLQQVQKINWHPKSMRKQIEIWIERLNWDWCISRQRYFGVPFPVWYSKEDGKVILPDINKLPVDPVNDLPEGYQDTEVEADTDVMDTWATSSLSIQFHNTSTIPTNLRAQSHEIIRSWAFYTILQAYYYNNDIPWENIMISGWCLAEDKTKMSKSKGNVLTPNKLLEEYGADVVRYWAANSKLGADTTFSSEILKLGKRFTTKLWNASKFVSMVVNQYSEVDLRYIKETMDKWILSKLYKVIIKATESFNSFEYCIALEYIESFFWQDFCDDYLELSKKRAYGEVNSQETLSAIHTLSFVLRELLKMLAPFIPYITEEIYNTLYSNNNSIHNHNNWPIADSGLYSESDELLGEDFIEILNQVRKLKANAQLSVKYKINKLIISSQNCNFPSSLENDLKAVCNADHIVYVNKSIIDTNEEKFLVSAEFANE